MSIVYQSEATRGKRWQARCRERAPERSFFVWPECGPLRDVRYLIAFQPPGELIEQCPNLQVLFSVGAGVDQLDLDAIPAELPVVRMIDDGLTQGMMEYVVCTVLAAQRDLPAYLAQQRRHVWHALDQRPAATTHVGIMGLGQLGRAVLEPLKALGLVCEGWSRSARTLDGVRVHSGADELGLFLSRTDILVCLLPLTDETHGLLNRHRFDQLPEGATLIHVGRGGQLVIDDLIDALDRGQLRSAIIDVVDPEPLPADHPLWDHPRVWLTPHIASSTQADTAIDAIIDNIERYEAGQPTHGVVDRQRGY